MPKSLYAVEEEGDKDRSPDESHFGTDSLYHTAYVVKDFAHEVRGAPGGRVVLW